MKDSQGKAIEPGDFVAYAIRDGNSSTMKFGICLESEPDRIKVVSAIKGWSGWEVAKLSTLYRNHAIVGVGFDQLSLELASLLNNAYQDRMTP